MLLRATKDFETALLLGLGIVFIYLLGRRMYRSRRHTRRCRPPGPKGWPIIGNLLDVPRKGEMWKVYAEMSQKYGDMTYLEVVGQPVLILSSVQRVNDLLNKRSTNYSSRPWSMMVNELLGAGFMIVVMRYGEPWRQRRRLLQSYLRKTDTDELRRIQSRATSALLKDLSNTPEDFVEHIRRHSATIILKLVYGYDVQKRDPLIRIVEVASHHIMEAFRDSPWVVDIFPVLRHLPKWIPGAKFQRRAAEGAHFINMVLNQPFDRVKELMANNCAMPCLVMECLEKPQIHGLVSHANENPEDIIKDSAATAYFGGVDTTSSTLLTFILAMVLYPDIQLKAQAELDSIVGQNRLPTFDDISRLPYIQCIVSETARWQPVAPLCIPHVSSSDDEYDGYHIPAGTIIFPNVWSMFRDEKVYPEPEMFNPDRFLPGKDDTIIPPDPSSLAFGFGRRICPGKKLAQDTVWLTIASILSKFRITYALDENEEDIIPEACYTNVLIS